VLIQKGNKKLSSAEIANLLNQLNEEGGFSMSVLTDMQGFPLASSNSESIDPERQAAVMAKVQKTLQQVSSHMGMGTPDEVIVSDIDGNRLVSRTFSIKDFELILSIQIPNRKQAYRGLMNKLIKNIQMSWML